MPEKGFFKVEEIGRFKVNPYAIFLKGRKKSIFNACMHYFTESYERSWNHKNKVG